MPTGLHRYYGAQDLHFITVSCYQRYPWLGTAARRNMLLRILEETRISYGFVVVGYVVMPEHVHLLMSEPEKGTPSTVMQVLKQRFARKVLQQMRRKVHRRGKLLWDDDMAGWPILFIIDRGVYYNSAGPPFAVFEGWGPRTGLESRIF